MRWSVSWWKPYGGNSATQTNSRWSATYGPIKTKPEISVLGGLFRLRDITRVILIWPQIGPCARAHFFSLAGQFTAISINRPGCSRSLVVNRIPPLLMSSVFPDPVTCTALDCRTLYRTSSFTGNRLFPRRSTVPPKFFPPDLCSCAVMFLIIMMRNWILSNNSPKALIAL